MSNSTIKEDQMNLINLTNKVITSIELLAGDYEADPSKENYTKKVNRIAKILDKPSSLVDKVIRKAIGEEWKSVKNHPTYKISNY